MKREDMNKIELLEEYVENVKKTESETGRKMQNFIVISDLGTMSYCDVPNMMSLLTYYMKERKDQGVLTDDMMNEIVRIAKMSEEELEKATKEITKKMLEELKNGLMGKEEE